MSVVLFDTPTFKWATVHSTNPVLIQLDGDTAPLAMLPDSLVDPDTLSVGARVRVELSQRKAVIHGVAKGGGSPIGQVTMFAGATAPVGWLLCNGSVVSRTQYADLFRVIGTTFGAGNGTTTFSVPNYTGRMPVGPGGAASGGVGQTGGSAYLAARIGRRDGAAADANLEMEPRAVTTAWSSSNRITGASGSNSGTQSVNRGVSVVGNNDPNSSLPPYTTINFIIKAL